MHYVFVWVCACVNMSVFSVCVRMCEHVCLDVLSVCACAGVFHRLLVRVCV